MIKKGLTIVVITIVGLAIVGMFGTVAAADMIIETELKVSGTGSFDRDMAVHTEQGYAGKRLTETFYTRYLGTDGESELKYASSLGVFMGNSTERENETVSDIIYAQTAVATNATQVVCASNYDLGCVGAAQGFSAKGPYLAKSFETAMDDQISEFEIEGEVIGRVRLMQKVADPDSRLNYLEEDTRLDGEYAFEWSAYAEQSCYPEGEGDWLGCP